MTLQWRGKVFIYGGLGGISVPCDACEPSPPDPFSPHALWLRGGCMGSFGGCCGGAVAVTSVLLGRGCIFFRSSHNVYPPFTFPHTPQNLLACMRSPSGAAGRWQLGVGKAGGEPPLFPGFVNCRLSGAREQPCNLFGIRACECECECECERVGVRVGVHPPRARGCPLGGRRCPSDIGKDAAGAGKGGAWGGAESVGGFRGVGHPPADPPARCWSEARC